MLEYILTTYTSVSSHAA